MIMDNTAIKAESITKVYKLYDNSIERLKESLHPFRKTYHKEFYALNNVSFQIKKGETIGVIGKNGSGKSTLLKILTGIMRPTKGKVEVNGKVSALLELGAGFDPELTGLENIYLIGTIMGYKREEMDSKLDDILSFADIGGFVYQSVKMYSSGMFARLAFAVSVNVNPDILIVDEVLSVGDMKFQLKCIEKMKSFKEQGKTIFYVSHDTYSVRNFCTQAMWMMDGQIHMLGDVKTVTDYYQDYMKYDSELEGEKNEEENVPQERDILTIDKVTFSDENKKKRNEFKLGEKLTVIVDYTLLKPMEGIVGGVALFDRQGTYICGLNTKLDNYSLPTNPGKYKLVLLYDEISLLPGQYFVDVGFFESSGLVRLDYKTREKYFMITSNNYIAEGLTLIKHNWKYEGG